MRITDLIITLEDETNALLLQYTVIAESIQKPCDHAVCESCMKNREAMTSELDSLSRTINTKTEMLNSLKQVQQ